MLHLSAHNLMMCNEQEQLMQTQQKHHVLHLLRQGNPTRMQQSNRQCTQLKTHVHAYFLYVHVFLG